MSTSIAIGLVSESLKSLLEDEFTGMNASAEVTILPPDQASSDNRRVNLFLFKVEESPYLRNKEWEADPNNPGQLIPPPLSLHLHYLITPYGPNDDILGNIAVHQILGEAMRIFYEFAIVPGQYLAAGLLNAREQIKISQTHLDLDELSKIWSTFDVPFRLSVAYEVSVVQIDQIAAPATSIPPRVLNIGVPQVRAPFNIPRIIGVSPIALAAGAQLTFNGENLDGWLAYVTISGRRIVDGLAISGNSFSATVPVDLAAGFHSVQVDISRIHRSSFFVEVQ